MALRVLTPKEVGERVAEVRRRVGMGSVKMSLAMGRDKQFISRWTTGRRKLVDRAELADIANFAEGRGDFRDIDAQTILDYFDGRFDSWEIEIRPSLRSVEQKLAITKDSVIDGRKPLPQDPDSATGTGSIGWFQYSPSDLLERVAS